MKPDLGKLVEPTRDDLIHAIRHAMLYRRGSKRRHDFDAINAKVAAEVLIDGLAASNYVIMRGPPGLAPSSAPAAQVSTEDVAAAEAEWK